MTASAPPLLYSTVSRLFIADWLEALRPLYSQAGYQSLLNRADLTVEQDLSQGRVTLDQLVCLYQLAAVETGDEMMGLWSRPVRPRALQHLLTSVREATSLPSALYRFSTFWNLILDDYQFVLHEDKTAWKLSLEPLGKGGVQRFGHMLILKLAHGLLSWLARQEVPVKEVGFAFERPVFVQDYAVIYPAPVIFQTRATYISFAPEDMGPVGMRSTADLDQFLENAPRDWIFTRSREHTQALRVRSYLSRTGWEQANLTGAAQFLNMTPRTLIRKLEADGTSFQRIKDDLRRDIAIRYLSAGGRSVETVAHEVGFSSAANFHRAFQRWTGSTPRSYRRQSKS
ncbi:helix-turn-helix domain-containing protein [Neptunicoccus cionae]|uniref:helix-turn-helix domain-containing protein n=1 Tax=Neptunicoccus cionae TaxID=2035344 RepID=UPI000C77BE51|nr:AraC family transcriptional regulator [Amylibacter cionae]PLS21287.1 AraC family transcriptional regulator [Amylibacter cionae]